MHISDITYTKINQLLTATFQMNSFADNVAYNLSAARMVQTEPVFHSKFAHVFPALADEISDTMLKLDARPVRGALNANDVRYESIYDMFSDVERHVMEYRKQIIDVIENAEYNDDFEIKIFLEEFLNKFLVYVDQAKTWVVKADLYRDNEKSFDNHFTGFTNI